MFTIGLYLFCVAIEGDFHQKIQARGGKIQSKYRQLLIIRELGGGLYLFYCLAQANYTKKDTS